MSRRSCPRGRRGASCRRGLGGGTSADCWDLYDKIKKMQRRVENAEYRFYDRGIYPKNKTADEVRESIAKLRARYDALQAEFTKKGC